jgi:hypothetical protein
MAAIGPLKYAYLAYFSQPKSQRVIYQQIKKLGVKRIVEVGIGSIERAVQMINVAQRFSSDKSITYTGFDWFEEREAGQSPLPLIHAHRQMQLCGAKARLVPGFPPATLPQIANSLQRTDLMLISHLVDDAALERTWFYMPRMCHPTTVILREQLEPSTGGVTFARLSLEDLQRRSLIRKSRKAA